MFDYFFDENLFLQRQKIEQGVTEKKNELDNSNFVTQKIRRERKKEPEA